MRVSSLAACCPRAEESGWKATRSHAEKKRLKERVNGRLDDQRREHERPVRRGRRWCQGAGPSNVVNTSGRYVEEDVGVKEQVHPQNLLHDGSPIGAGLEVRLADGFPHEFVH